MDSESAYKRGEVFSHLTVVIVVTAVDLAAAVSVTQVKSFSGCLLFNLLACSN
jgi:hypothetical protein